MPEDRKYKIVSADTIKQLVEKVNSVISSGYRPTGGLIIDETVNLDELELKRVYRQAMYYERN